jgi:selenocysteine lyase/cysteine desulfurase
MRNFNRRSFLQAIKALSAGSLLSTIPIRSRGKDPNNSNNTVWDNDPLPAWGQNLQQALKKAGSQSPAQLAADENFWSFVRQSYTGSPHWIDLNSAGMAASPKVVHNAMKDYADLCNEIPSYNLRRVLDQGKELLRHNLACLCGCTAEELAIQRNATEALDTIIFGLTLKAGDEVVLSRQDYSTVISAWKQRELRDGIKLVWVNLQLPSEDNEYLANAFINAFTANTKVVNITHMINWNGQILPVKTIADAAHKKGIEVVVDGAQSFAQFKFTIPELGADYFGASLHKWLSAPIGTGLLYVKKEKIKNLYAFYAPANLQSNEIQKFEHCGTRPAAIEQAIHKAIDFHEMIGQERKEQRLMYLKNYWMSKVQHLPGVELGTSMKPGFGCAIGMVHIKNRNPQDVAFFLAANYKIHVIGVEIENIKGLRVSPNVFTTTKELDLLVEGIGAFIKS